MQVDVDVYRRVAPVRAEPGNNAPSFFTEALGAWRELNSASHFLTAAAEVNNLVQTLPQLLHHKDDVAGILLSRVHMGAVLSLPALLDLLAVLARDLQGEYVHMLPRVLRTLAELLAQGGDRDPEVMEVSPARQHEGRGQEERGFS